MRSAGVPATSCPIIDINLTNTATGMSANKKISLGGGVLTGTIGVSPERPASLQIGRLNSVVHKTFKVVSQP